MASNQGDDQDAALAGPRNFYCHQCHSRTRVGAEEFTCVSCGSGFIEEISNNESDNFDDPQEEFGQALADFSEHILPIFGEQFGGGVSNGSPSFLRARIPGGPPGSGGSPGTGVSPGNAGPHGAAIEAGGVPMQLFHDQFLQTLISNLTGAPIGGHRMAIQLGPGGAFGFGPGGGNVMYGNPGDYVWGRGGFDAIVTQLLNQMEGRGPPPMAKDVIEKVPEVKVQQQHIDQKLQCSVCWDDFKLEEPVRQLNCDHIFHSGCIVPWLQLHATCPVCRKPLTDDARASMEEAEREHDGRGEGNGGSGGGSSNRSQASSFGNARQSEQSSESRNRGTASDSGRPATAEEPESANLGTTISMVFNHFFGQPSQGQEAWSDAASEYSSAAPSATGSNQAPETRNEPQNHSNNPQQGNQHREYYDFDPE